MIKGENIWNFENQKKLVELRNKGLTGAQIAARIPGATRNSVIGKLNRLGLRMLTKQTKIKRAYRDRVYTASRTAKRSIGGRPKAYRYGQPLPLPMEEQIPATAVTFAELEEHHCRFPYGMNSTIKFCGADKTHRSYCDYHHRKCCYEVS